MSENEEFSIPTAFINDLKPVDLSLAAQWNGCHQHAKASVLLTFVHFLTRYLAFRRVPFLYGGPQHFQTYIRQLICIYQ